jgi:adenylate cyclase
MIDSTDILHGKILIVDDRESNIALLEQMLRGAGYDSIASTTDSTKVCELHLVNHYDLILLDLEMPGMDGFQVMENLKEIEVGGYLPVLVITAQPGHKLRALKSGARDFISKPFDLPEVLMRVYNMLEVRLLHLEAKKLYSRVVAEQKVSERLLLKTLPASTCERLTECLKRRSETATERPADLISDSFAELTMVFADVVEFAKFSEGGSAEALKGVLDDISRRLEPGANNPSLERTKTIGDAHLALVGQPDSVAGSTIRASHMAMDMIGAVDRFNEHSRYKLKVRFGFDTPADVAGGIGKLGRPRDL